jgi:hypothetical protein
MLFFLVKLCNRLFQQAGTFSETGEKGSPALIRRMEGEEQIPEMPLAAFVRILRENPFMDTLSIPRLPCGITSVARRQGQDERELDPL